MIFEQNLKTMREESKPKTGESTFSEMGSGCRPFRGILLAMF
jgi:hypothetical protein